MRNAVSVMVDTWGHQVACATCATCATSLWCGRCGAAPHARYLCGAEDVVPRHVRHIFAVQEMRCPKP
eukprot:8190378-Alexandrium_andersonii.AAC.1